MRGKKRQLHGLHQDIGNDDADRAREAHETLGLHGKTVRVMEPPDNDEGKKKDKKGRQHLHYARQETDARSTEKSDSPGDGMMQPPR